MFTELDVAMAITIMRELNFKVTANSVNKNAI